MGQIARSRDLYVEKMFAELEKDLPHCTGDSIWRTIDKFFRSFKDALHLVRVTYWHDTIYAKYLLRVYPNEMLTYWDTVQAMNHVSSDHWYNYYVVDWETNSIIGKEIIPFPKKELYGDNMDGDKWIGYLSSRIEEHFAGGRDVTYLRCELAALEEWKEIWENYGNFKPAKATT